MDDIVDEIARRIANVEKLCRAIRLFRRSGAHVSRIAVLEEERDRQQDLVDQARQAFFIWPQQFNHELEHQEA